MIRSCSEYTKQHLRKLAWFSLTKNELRLVLYIVFEILTILIAVIYFINTSAPYIPAAFAAILLPLIVPLRIFVQLTINIMNIKSAIGAVIICAFSETEVSTESTRKGGNAHSTMDYTFIHKVYETRDTFYIYTSKTGMLIIEKSDITEGSAEELQSLLQSKIPPEKYSITYKQY